jgi:phage baseplate assembly protein W
MAIVDTTRKPYIEDRDSSHLGTEHRNMFIGMDYPFHKSEGLDGWFAGTDTTIKAVKNNIHMLLSTEKGERLLQPNLGIGLRRFLFEQFTNETVITIQNEIVDVFKFWLPFVEIRELEVTMNEADAIGKNAMSIFILFNITKDPNTLESVQIEIGE